MPSLEEKTASYWKIQLAYNQRPEVPMISVSDALLGLNDIMFNFGPHRALVNYCWKLRKAIIYGDLKTDREISRNV